MTLRDLFRSTCRKRHKEKLVAIATNVPQEMPPYPDIMHLEVMFNSVVWARENISQMLQALRGHVHEHTDPMHCDPWCLPKDLDDYLGSLTKEQLLVLFVVLLKSYYWTMQATDSSEA